MSFGLVTVDARAGDGSPLRAVRGAAGDVFGPVERAAAAVVGPVDRLVDAARSLGSSQDRIRALEAQNRELRRQVHTSQLDRGRARQLDRLLGLAGLGRYRVLPAQVVAIGPAQGFGWTVTIDVGSRDGARPNLTVVNGDGLVGRVTTVSRTTATVLLAGDPTASVGVRLESTMQVGIATGTGTGPLALTLLDPQTPVRARDRLVTFGSRGSAPFVPGVPVGEVVRVESTPGALTKTATVAPYVNFTALDLVGVVVQPPRRDPRDSVLPPKPHPKPRPERGPNPRPKPGRTVEPRAS